MPKGTTKGENMQSSSDGLRATVTGTHLRRASVVAVISMLGLGLGGVSAAASHPKSKAVAHANIKAAQGLITKYEATVPFKPPGPSLKTGSLSL